MSFEFLVFSMKPWKFGNYIVSYAQYWQGVSIRLGRSIDTIIKDNCHLRRLSQFCCNVMNCTSLFCQKYSILVLQCTHNYCKEWYGLPSGDNYRGNGDTKTISKRGLYPPPTHPPQSRFTPHNLSVEGQEARTRYNQANKLSPKQ